MVRPKDSPVMLHHATLGNSLVYELPLKVNELVFQYFQSGNFSINTTANSWRHTLSFYIKIGYPF